MVIDTSNLNVHQLTARVAHILWRRRGRHPARAGDELRLQEWRPLDADLYLRRPLPAQSALEYPSCGPRPGLSKEVGINYVLEQPGAEEFLTTLDHLFEVVTPGYLREEQASG